MNDSDLPLGIHWDKKWLYYDDSGQPWAITLKESYALAQSGAGHSKNTAVQWPWKLSDCRRARVRFGYRPSLNLIILSQSSGLFLLGAVVTFEEDGVQTSGIVVQTVGERKHAFGSFQGADLNYREIEGQDS